MAPEITIRPVQADDIRTVQSLFQQEADRNGFSFDESSPYHPAKSAATVIEKTLNKDDVNCGWLAFSDGKPAGIITTPQGLAGGVFVAPEFRGQGIAQALVRTRERYFKQDLGLTGSRASGSRRQRSVHSPAYRKTRLPFQSGEPEFIKGKPAPAGAHRPVSGQNSLIPLSFPLHLCASGVLIRHGWDTNR